MIRQMRDDWLGRVFRPAQFLFRQEPGGCNMRIVSLVAMIVCAAPVWAGDPASTRLGFDKGKVDEMPPGWKAGVTGKGAKDSVWKLMEDKTAPGGKLALFQTSKNGSA